MKKFLSVGFVCAAVLFCFTGCDAKNQPLSAEELYKHFLVGEIPAVDQDGNQKYLTELLYLNSRDDQSYTFIDMTGDEIPELCFLDYVEHYFFTVKENQVTLWAYNNGSHNTLLNNGALLWERHGDGPAHNIYEYTKYDHDGNVAESVSFSWWDSHTDDKGKTFPESYFIGEEEVTKEEYEKTTAPYFSIGSEKIIWHRLNETASG